MADSIPDQLQFAKSSCPAKLQDHNPSYVIFEKVNGDFGHASINQLLDSQPSQSKREKKKEKESQAAPPNRMKSLYDFQHSPVHVHVFLHGI